MSGGNSEGGIPPSDRSASFFRLLGSLLYNDPSREVIDTLADEGVFAELPYAAESALARKGQKEMLDWLKSAPRDELALEARTEYMRLLIGIGKELAPPWGSVYQSVERLMFTEDTLRVRLFYEKHGMKLKEKYHEPDDHIGLELEFLAYLSEQGKIAAAREFAAEYIVPWISRWNADVQKHAETGFYKGLGNMAAGGIDYFMNGSPVS
jgi:TorA maturation chaperone TorD